MMYKSTDHGSDVKFYFMVVLCVLCSASLRSSVHSLRIRMTSYPCNKYEQITPSNLLSAKYIVLSLHLSTFWPIFSPRSKLIGMFRFFGLKNAAGEENVKNDGKEK